MHQIVMDDLTDSLGRTDAVFAVSLLSSGWLATVDRLVREGVDGTG